MTLKNIVTPIGLDVVEAEALLKHVAAGSDPGTRLERLSALLLGRAYVEGSLGGGPQSPEEFRGSLVAFDCVTFIETVLALALARTIDEFVDALRQIRYEDGEIDWFHRNHYMVDWAKKNEDRGFIKNLTSGPYALVKTCTLGLVAGLKEKTASFSYFPTRSRAEVARLFETGDLVLFVSTKETLDVFHTGFLIERDGTWLLRHATRKAGAVIDQELGEFIDGNEMEGFVLLRPLCPR